ncbi:MAG TPA: TRAP transporter large permease [Rhodospirillales bacterium]|jgi:tripartite ATP-independent transporter DctM subunit|nr:TRAP transporter large permease [Rhodospirillales bacterium]MDP7426032.1 TRAP transporter large permease [Rhodospirillales bacterium]MDP7625750.1 TRAP transporter large permease [Rhodospirillales bacterium]HJO87899.1 TRAP transporter large permease [Rhodospirillales bacterium]|tara:strand:- start:309 stop:1601 length:1293 start_codon:yes stop_codon:yes gene_type:complete
MLTAAIGLVILFVLLFGGVPIAFGMIIVGTVGFAYLSGLTPAMAMVGQVAFDTVLNYEFSVLPLFILMGNFITRSRLSEELYTASYAFLGHRRGGLAMATIVACAGFSAVCGSSLATAATMSKVAMPSMRRFGYADSLAAGSIAAGGTLGILIPPSVILVLYGIMTETEIGKLFAAGFLPGLLGMVLYMVSANLVSRFRPELGPPADRTEWPERMAAMKGIWGILMLFMLVMGGIYLGVFSPTEAAGIGASGAFFFALARRTLNLRAIAEVLIETGRTSTMVFIVLIGAIMFSNFVDVTRAPNHIQTFVENLQVAPIYIILIILAIYIVLGCVLDSIAMMLLTVPIFYPLVAGLGYDLIWFGIIVVVVIEISLITPPIGLNVYVLRATLPDVALGTIFRGVTPFIVADIIRLALLVLLPGFVMLLPNLMD